MQIPRRVGVLLPVTVLRRITSRKPTYESAIEYAVGARAVNMEAVLFSPNLFRPGRKTIRGFVWRNNSWQLWQGPLPRVVHNRLLPSAVTRRFLSGLSRELGPGLFNPFFSRDKWDAWRRFKADPDIKPYLPPTWQLHKQSMRQLPKEAKSRGGLVMKPRRGSLGLGIVFFSHRRKYGSYRLTPARGTERLINKTKLVRYARGLPGKRKYVLQEMIPLMKYKGRRCDLRVPVQRDGSGQWRVVTPTVKRAIKHRYLTNIAQGGQALDFRLVVEEVFGAKRMVEIENQINKLSLAVASHLAKVEPRLADIGLDVGIDTAGKPWLIEVNFRDQRLVSKHAGQLKVHAQQYHNPMAYAAYLLAHGALSNKSS